MYAEKVRVSASKLNDLSDLYMQIGQIINGVYTLVVTEPYCVDEEKMTVVDDAVSYTHLRAHETDSEASMHSFWKKRLIFGRWRIF